MIPDDQGVTEEWILRVDGREYGPANIETLREWKAEGRVLPANEARRADAELWSLAAEIPGLFNVEALPTFSAPRLIHSTSSGQAPPPLPPRGFEEILTGTFRIYATGFLQFFSLTLLVVLPSVCAQLTAIWMQTGRASDAHRLVARKSKSSAQRHRASVVSTSVVARRLYCVSLVCVGVGDRARLGVDDASAFSQ